MHINHSNEIIFYLHQFEEEYEVSCLNIKTDGRLKSEIHLVQLFPTTGQ